MPGGVGVDRAAAVHPLLRSLAVCPEHVGSWRVTETPATLMISDMRRADALRLVRSATRQGLLAEAVKPPDPTQDWRAVILKPLQIEDAPPPESL